MCTVGPGLGRETSFFHLCLLLTLQLENCGVFVVVVVSYCSVGFLTEYLGYDSKHLNGL